ncbi:MAG: MFS transporter [Archaeoglobaceae archaeon]|nr:MFS transporter [Archaeoglobaceae archaeon]MDW8117732.1 MFS transporter [Archaeoglobaceae archaeon]
MEKALRFVLLMGIVSLLGDTTYEGARSVMGAYLATFGISALLLGFVVGIGEFLSYGFRIFSGYLADKSQRYWAFTFVGYALIFSIPLIAFTNSIAIILLLIILERLGKALRSPARDTLISFATAKIGRGTGFGIHEALDQIGAVLGPMIFFIVLYMGYGYKDGFLILFVPTFLLILTLLSAKKSYVGEEVRKENEDSLSKAFWLYILFTIFAVAGLVNFQLLAYHFKLKSIFSDELIPILYALAMGIDAISAILVGKAYDKLGLRCLLLVPVLTPISVALSLGANPILGLILFGAIIGMQESIMRAGVAEMTGVGKRATAYGILNTGFGLGFFIGSFLMGALYEISLDYLILFSLGIEIVAFWILMLIIREIKD